MKERVKRLRKLLAERELAGLILRVNESGQSTQPNNQNVLYLSGFGGSTAVLLVTRKRCFIIADARYWSRAKLEAPDFRLVKVKRGEKFSNFINEALALAKLPESSKVGFEADRVPFSVAEEWKKNLSVKLEPVEMLVESLRQYKDALEIKHLRSACRKTCSVYREIEALVRPGMKEVELALEIDSRLRQHGATDNSFQTIVASGPNSAIPHHATGQRKLRAGEPVVMDFGGVFAGGYCSDITRTVFVPGREPDAQMKEIYKVVLEANRRARLALTPAMTIVDYDRVARDYIESRGFGKYFTHGLGHSLGLEAHDPFDYKNSSLDVGTVVTDEPGIYIEGVGGVRIEDDLLVTANGAVKLTSAPYWRF